MFCPTCGAEYSQKINFCKQCGSNMTQPANNVEVHLPRPRFTGMFFAIAALGIVGLIACFTAFGDFAQRGLHGDELLAPFFLGLLFVFGIAGGLIWQLSRLISTFKQSVKAALTEPTPLLMNQPSRLVTPLKPGTSVTEHTTRSFDPALYLEAEKRRHRE